MAHCEIKDRSLQLTCRLVTRKNAGDLLRLVHQEGDVVVLAVRVTFDKENQVLLQRLFVWIQEDLYTF